MKHAIHLDASDAVTRICRHLNEAGGHAYLVGGCVRDMMLHRTPKDMDIEVYGLTEKEIGHILGKLGHCETVGRSFGVIKCWMENLEVDVALPRQEYKIASGHRGFRVQTDPHLAPETASSRRDFTINAMMFDPISEILFDFHGGERDLDAGVLRHISPAFAEDPLRVLRAMQFAARFDLELHPDTALLCQQLLCEAGTLAVERIWQEWRKWAEGRYPSRGLTVLQQSGWLELYPELTALIDCPQNPKWHPEGNVWTHTLQVVDWAAEVAEHHDWHGQQRWLLVFSALTHDFGKPAVTITDDTGTIRSPNHAIEGVALARHFFSRIGAPATLTRNIEPLIREHLTHMHGQPTDRAVRRLAQRLEPANIELWEALVEADASGRAPHPPSRPALAWLQKAETLTSHRGTPPPLLTGKMLLELGMSPGPEMGEVLSAAYGAQLDGVFSDTEDAIRWYRQQKRHTE
ncbi:MAG TPA: HD domain-containing protein [Mariprofundaceae bacterium]|nr:HD domain-containing protein [Mariprofundaceae bacterium]